MIVSRQVYEALGLLTPFDIDRTKVRVGSERDGAYVMIEPDGTPDIISFGVSDNVCFERELADKGHRSFMFDHTIEHLPEENERFHWERLGVCSHPGALQDCLTLEQHLAAHPDTTNRLILKMDIEGHKWGVFLTVEQNTLERFDQILLEIHWLRFLDQPGFLHNFVTGLTKINRQFTLHHVHANNCAGMMFVSGFPVADVLELSYVRTELIHRTPSTTVYPTAINKGNRSDRHDLPLLFYPFLPSTIGKEQTDEMMNRVERECDAIQL